MWTVSKSVSISSNCLLFKIIILWRRLKMAEARWYWSKVTSTLKNKNNKLLLLDLLLRDRGKTYQLLPLTVILLKNYQKHAQQHQNGNLIQQKWRSEEIQAPFFFYMFIHDYGKSSQTFSNRFTFPTAPTP